MAETSYGAKAGTACKMPLERGMPLTGGLLCGCDTHPCEHGNNKPAKEVTAEIEEMTGSVPGSGCVLIGDKGKIFSPDDYGARFFIKLNGEKELSESKNHDAVKAIPQTIPRNAFQADTDKRHHLEWIAGCKGGPTPYSNFDIT